VGIGDKKNKQQKHKRELIYYKGAGKEKRKEEPTTLKTLGRQQLKERGERKQRRGGGMTVVRERIKNQLLASGKWTLPFNLLTRPQCTKGSGKWKGKKT